ncbi:hypothetical protein [Cohnella phaseoli]|uniref:DUF4367 domain-containing protein n=1 Tax=Cohnella phaseoli TaxID=456490 RepID=A0A3D9JP49_9BACL|nr:hypothetical protein [Cohnella phaseoli]RED75745.1 hypothetical protein DFP98_114106 [Cohnella phaseoli]
MKRFIISTIFLISVSISGIVFASSGDISTNNGVKHEVRSDNNIVTKPSTITVEKAKELLTNIEFQLPTYVPNNLIVESVIYNEPPSQFPNGVMPNIDLDKEITIRYRDTSNEENWIDYTTKKRRIELADDGVKSIVLNGLEVQYLELTGKNIVAYNWFSKGASHMVIARGDISKDQLIKFVTSFN